MIRRPFRIEADGWPNQAGQEITVKMGQALTLTTRGELNHNGKCEGKSEGSWVGAGGKSCLDRCLCGCTGNTIVMLLPLLPLLAESSVQSQKLSWGSQLKQIAETGTADLVTATATMQSCVRKVEVF